MKTVKNSLHFSLNLMASLTMIMGLMLSTYIWFQTHKTLNLDGDATTAFVQMAALPLMVMLNFVLFQYMSLKKWRQDPDSFRTFFFTTALTLLFATEVLAPIYLLVSHRVEADKVLTFYNLLCMFGLLLSALPLYLDKRDYQNILASMKEPVILFNHIKIPKFLLSEWTISIVLGLIMIAVYPLTMGLLPYLYIFMWGYSICIVVQLVVRNIKFRRQLRMIPENQQINLYYKTRYPKKLPLMIYMNRIVFVPLVLIAILSTIERMK